MYGFSHQIKRLLSAGATILVALLCLIASAAADQAPSIYSAYQQSFSKPAIAEVQIGELPREAQQTLELIKKGGPFPYARDGVTFHNREKRLPRQANGYYREYTVPTPGAKNRGARRIVAGKAAEFYYTSDHYRSFRLIKE